MALFLIYTHYTYTTKAAAEAAKIAAEAAQAAAKAEKVAAETARAAAEAAKAEAEAAKAAAETAQAAAEAVRVAAEAEKAEAQAAKVAAEAARVAAEAEKAEAQAAKVAAEAAKAAAEAEKAAAQAAKTAAEAAKVAAETAKEAAEKAKTEAETFMSQATDEASKAKAEAALAKAEADAAKAEADLAAAEAKIANTEAAKAKAEAAVAKAEASAAKAEAAAAIARAAEAKAKADALEAELNKADEQLSAPTGVKATNIANTGKVKLTWTAVEGADEYIVYRATSKDGAYKKMFTTTGTQYTNTSAKAGTTYYYKVKAVSFDKDVEDSAYSKIVKRTCDLARPAVKASNVAKTGKVKLTWSKVSGAEMYKVYRAESKTGKYKYLGKTSKLYFINKSAVAGKTYYYKVKAIDTDNSAANSAFSAVDKRTCDAARPVVTAKSTAKKQIKLTWKKVDGAKKYVVYRATSKNGKYTKFATTTKLTYTNKSLKSGKTYYYKVKAIAKNSNANSAYSVVDKCKCK